MDNKAITPGGTQIRRRTVYSFVVAAAMLLMVGVVTDHAMEESLKTILVKNLHTIIEAETNSLKIWFDTQRNQVQIWSRATGLEEAMAPLLKNPPDAGTSPTLKTVQALGDVREALDGIQNSTAYRMFIIADRSGKILASDKIDRVGVRLSADTITHLLQVFEKGVYISRPVLAEPLLAEGSTSSLPAIIISGATVSGARKDQEATVALMVVMDPKWEFTRILSLAGLGETGKTFAFGGDGVLLSDTRYDPELRELGLLSKESSSGAMLRFEAREPQGDLTRGYKPSMTPSRQPFIRSVAAAIDTRTGGYELESYRDFRGVPVVGAWQWLDDYNIGLATELDMAEIRATIFPLKLAFGFLYALLVLATVFIIYRFYIGRKLNARFERIRQLGQYELREKIGEGGMGTIYRARHALLTRPTAIKLLKREDVQDDDLARFEREVQMTSRLTHPNTIEIYDFGRSEDGVFYYVMEYLNGISFARLIEVEGHIGPARTIYLLRQVLGSLQEAHAQGFIHRDIKPLNLYICQRGGLHDFVKVIDFGLVKNLYSADTSFQTETSVLAGTPLYIAPERLNNPQYLDPRSDLYSVGMVAFHLLTGKEPFQANSSLELLHRVMNEKIPPPSKVLGQPLPPEIDRLVLDMLAKEPDQRPPGAEAVIERLNGIQLADRWTQAEARDWAARHEAWFVMPADSEEPDDATAEYLTRREAR